MSVKKIYDEEKEKITEMGKVECKDLILEDVWTYVLKRQNFEQKKSLLKQYQELEAEDG